jgi:hypothetical protein
VWHKIKAFPRNIEIEVAATYAGGSRYGDESVIDNRGKTVIIHYGLCQLPEPGYQPRVADDRVGHFLSVVKDFSAEGTDSTFVRYINRWRLERAEPFDARNADKPSAPKKKIVYWIERSVPDEFRASVREGILEWNKAFEKIGFKDAIEVRQQQDEDFDPEDINYNTFRWITTDGGFAAGPSRANPLTGEILDADIIFDASMIRFWRQEYKQLYHGNEPASLIEATRRGWYLLPPELCAKASAGTLGWNERGPEPADLEKLQAHLRQVRPGLCQCGTHLRYELDLASLALANRGVQKSNEKVPDELLQQAVKETVMHEVGHTLGLRHNFKASTMLKNEQLHDTSITRVKGLSGSVMDYNPINLAPKGVKQGDYFSTTLGPYDYLAIEYAYKPLDSSIEGEREKLREIAKQLAKPGNDFATDEDMYASSDPLVNVWDLGSDPMKFGQERILLVSELLKGLSERVVEKGEGYQRARRAFDILLMQYANGTFLVSSYVGGVHMNRDHREDPDGRDPFVPAKADKQREALKFLQEQVLTDKPFQFPPELLRKLAADRWMHWGSGEAMAAVEYPVNQRVLGIQRVVLNHCFDAATMTRVQNNALQFKGDEKPLQLAEIFRSVTDGVWTDLAPPTDGKKESSSSVIRRNLQREYVKKLSELVLGKRSAAFSLQLLLSGMPAPPPDARSLARMHLREISSRIDAALKRKDATDDATRAHLEECQERIAKVLTASMQISE